MDIVRMGIIGLGNMGSEHVKIIGGGQIPGMELRAVCDIDPERIARASESLSSPIDAFDSAEALIKSGKVDAVLIATPHYFHPEYVKLALQNGVNALSEKPAGVFTKAVREVNELAAKSLATYAIMFNQRTNSIYRAMHAIVASGELGEIKRTSWLVTNWYRSQSYYDSGSWRATWAGEGGGVLLNQCPHNLDLWQWIVGMMPSRVRAFCHMGKWHDIEVEDDVTAYVEYPNGATGVFVTSTGDTPGTNRFEILCDGGKLVMEDEKLTKYTLETPEREFSATYTGGFGEPKYMVEEVKTDGANPQHAGVLRAFAGHILHGAPLIADGCEGIRGLTLSNAMHLSAWLDQTVELPLDEDLFLAELNRRRADSKHKDVSGKVLSTEGSYGA